MEHEIQTAVIIQWPFYIQVRRGTPAMEIPVEKNMEPGMEAGLKVIYGLCRIFGARIEGFSYP